VNVSATYDAKHSQEPPRLNGLLAGVKLVDLLICHGGSHDVRYRLLRLVPLESNLEPSQFLGYSTRRIYAAT
jgi:hypothetical protein